VLSNLLPPPPAAGSAAASRDLSTVLAVQQTRTAADMAAAKSDSDRSVFRFDDALGRALTPSAVPLTAAFFKHVADIDKADVKEAKDVWQRPRPSLMSTQVHALSPEKPNDWSYPSGHATFGYTTAVLLANMLPEKRAAIFARADVYAQHRIVLGVHFPTDVDAGRVAGTVIAEALLTDPQEHPAFVAARAELRKALGLSIVSPAMAKVAP
jgi:acid phosphatase (class A)